MGYCVSLAMMIGCDALDRSVKRIRPYFSASFVLEER